MQLAGAGVSQGAVDDGEVRKRSTENPGGVRDRAAEQGDVWPAGVLHELR